MSCCTPAPLRQENGACAMRSPLPQASTSYRYAMTVPFDDSLVQELVSSVLCGARTDCATRYHADVQQLIERAPEVFADMIDPVLGSTVL